MWGPMGSAQESMAAQASPRAGTWTGRPQASGSRRRCQPKESLTSRPRTVKPEGASVRPSGIPGKPYVSNPSPKSLNRHDAKRWQFGNRAIRQLGTARAGLHSSSCQVAQWPSRHDGHFWLGARDGREGQPARGSQDSQGSFLTATKGRRRVPPNGSGHSTFRPDPLPADSTAHLAGQQARDRYPPRLSSKIEWRPR
jgi:hypothetical protein